MTATLKFHASCVSINGKGVLLLGKSGSGKSDLALRLIDQGAILVGDDYVEIHPHGTLLLAKPAKRLNGLLELRGIGILKLPYIYDIPLFVVIKLIERNEAERMPESSFFDCFGLQVPFTLLVRV